MTTPPRSLNAWILLDEDEPSGTSYQSPNSSYQSLIKNGVYQSLDMLSVCFFITTPTAADTTPSGNGDSYTIQIGNKNSKHPDGSTTEEYLKWVIQDSKKSNPSIKVLATLGYGQDYFSNIFNNHRKTPQENANDFANNLVAYLKKYNLDGFDVDWEGGFASSITPQQFALLFTAIRQEMGSNYLLTLSPASVGTLDATTVNNCFDFVNLQLYSGFTSAVEFTNAGVNRNLLAYGAKFESTGNGSAAPFQTPQNANEEARRGAYNIITQWRLNSGDFQAEQAYQLILAQLWNGNSSNQFDDTPIANAAGNPNITGVQVYAGDVLNALQITNTGTFQGVKIPYLMPQHGGQSGAKQTVTLDAGDSITEVSGFTGVWFGWECVLQLTITTAKGRVYGPYGNMNGASSKTAFSFVAPSGQSIVAFSGSTVNVPLADGSQTDIIASLDVSFSNQTVNAKEVSMSLA